MSCCPMESLCAETALESSQCWLEASYWHCCVWYLSFDRRTAPYLFVTAARQGRRRAETDVVDH